MSYYNDTSRRMGEAGGLECYKKDEDRCYLRTK